jgi:hypothetical protein
MSRALTHGMVLLTLCGVATVGTASAQTPLERPVGTVLAIPLPEYTRFLAANAFPGLDANLRPIQGNNVSFLHLSQFAAGTLNTAIVTVGVTQRNTGQPARMVYFPTGGTGGIPALYRQLNASDIFVEQQLIGVGNQAIAQVEVRQENSGTYIPGLTRFFLVPADKLGLVQGVNVGVNLNTVHVQQTAIGLNNTAVAMVAVDQSNANNLALPGSDLINVVANINTNVIIQMVVGEGNTAVATIGVQQQNLPAPR